MTTERMTLEDYIHTQIELRGIITVTLGRAADGSSVSLITSSDKVDGMHFWAVSGNTVEHLAFVGTED